jgi:hypothetical protein
MPGTALASGPRNARRALMGKYFLGWLLGVPVVALVALWFFFG